MSVWSAATCGQTRAALDNIRLILDEAGGRMQDVLVMCIYIVVSARDEQACIVDALREYFPEQPPVTSWLVISAPSEPE